ncbi:MAG: nucleotidyltransferase domain-containing protein [Rickettsiales bacterium]|nr:nucleotidyltransferase domain-containing protein [Rickettsiales bacterium]
MLIDELYNKKDVIASIADKYGAYNIQVFGSVARQEETEGSDIDILISLPRGYDMFKQRIPLQEELIEILGRKVDLVVRHEINKHLKAEILDSARNL